MKRAAIVRSTQPKVELANIVWEDGPNEVIAVWDRKFYHAIYNIFTGYYYLDDTNGGMTLEEITRAIERGSLR